MSRSVLTRSTLLILMAAVSVGTSGCLAMAAGAAVGTAVGVTAAAVGTTAKVGAKVVGAGVRAVVPGDSKKDN